MLIRPVKIEEAVALCEIYNFYVENTTITFEETSVSVDEFAKRIQDVSAAHPWLVSEVDGDIVGYGYAGTWKPRGAYRYCVESTMYLAQSAMGKGYGTALYQQLIDELRKRGVHSILAGIATPNEPSFALHKKLGFEQVGLFRQVGKKFDRWLDVAYWELIL